MSIARSIYQGPPGRHSSTRANKQYIVIHNTANNASAQNEADYARRRTDSVNAHYYVDDTQIIQSMDTDLEAWHVGSQVGNLHGIAYEITGTNSKSQFWWSNHVAWDLLSQQIRHDCDEHDIVPRKLTVSQIKTGRYTGIITHDQARQAWGGTTHTDPGKNFPMHFLVAAVQHGVDEGVGDVINLEKGDKGERVKALQATLRYAGFDPGDVDGDYGPATSAALLAMRQAWGSSADDGDRVTGWAYAQLQVALAVKHGAGEPGPQGPQGEPGRDGVLDLPVGVEITGKLTKAE